MQHKHKSATTFIDPSQSNEPSISYLMQNISL